jgi:pimeloyl-ACP methyl ester carboxylesterase
MVFFLTLSIHAQSKDTLVDVGGYNMYFKIMKGKGTPILFEAGGGNDSSVWDGILEKIHKVTGATLITYDRSGFGQSQLNPNLENESDFEIENGITELEKGLSKLGFNNEIMLVSHSYGGLYNLLFAGKYPEKVTSVVLIDATLSNFWNEDLLTMRDMNVDISTIEKPSGDYYLNFNFNAIMRYVRTMQFPEITPVINVFPENSFPGYPAILSDRWRELHIEFGNQNANVSNIIAKGSAHAIFQDNPALIINTINKAYIETLDMNQQNLLLNKALDTAIELSVEAKVNHRSEHDLETLGYSFMNNDEFNEALEVFKLTTILFPKSYSAYNNYGDALLKVDRKEEAIKSYENSLELNPENAEAKAALEKM